MPPEYVVLALIIGIHILFGALFTKELIYWPKISLHNRIIFVALVWLIPFFGAFFAYRKVKLNWFSREAHKNSSVGNGLLEMDSFFNPGARHSIDAKEEVKLEITQSVEDIEKSKSSKKFIVPK